MGTKTTGQFNSRCHVCTSSSRVIVETCLSRGVSAEIISQKVNLAKQPSEKAISPHSIYRHRTHMGVQLLDNLRAKALVGLARGRLDYESLRKDEAENVLQLGVGYRGQLDSLIDAAIFQGDLRAASSLIGRRNEIFIAMAKMVDVLNSHATSITNQTLVASPSYLALRAALMKALAPFPAARAAVAKAMGELAAIEDKSSIEARLASPPPEDSASGGVVVDATHIDDPSRADIIIDGPMPLNEVQAVSCSRPAGHHPIALEDYSNGQTPER